MLFVHQGSSCERLYASWYVASPRPAMRLLRRLPPGNTRANIVPLQIANYTTSTLRVVLSSNASTVVVRASPSPITPSVTVARRRTRTSSKTRATRRVSNTLMSASTRSLIMPQ